MASSNDEANTHLTAGVCARKPLSTTCFEREGAVENAGADGRGSRHPPLSRVDATGGATVLVARQHRSRLPIPRRPRAPPRMNGNTAGAAAPVDQGGKNTEKHIAAAARLILVLASQL